MLNEETKKRALKMLERRDLSEKELTDRLIEKGEPQEDAQAVVAWLTRLGVVDDVRYAGLIVRHYAAKGYGQRRIREELYRRGIPRELWDEALEQMPQADEKLDALLQARLRGGQPGRDELRKAAGALARRGFSHEESTAAIARCVADEPSE